ncbi:MAG TPA: diphthine synthase [Thermoplasmata archaeon]|nr:diphthine synthase [Thermoplasmata archaeon]
MAVLWFIGAGLDDERGLSARALEVLRTTRTVFAEEYTSVLAPGSLDRLADALGAPIVCLDRASLESGVPVLEALTQGGPIALLTAGDPFAATTHVALRLACEKAGHTWKYLPAASIVTAAAGFLGLMQYRFGRVVSVPFTSPGFAPTSPLLLIERNRSMDLHTLVLLDLRPSEHRFLAASEALEYLFALDADRRVLAPDRPLGVVARVGTDSAQAWWGVPEVLRRVDFGPPLHAVIVPAPTLHFEEEAAVERYRVL